MPKIVYSPEHRKFQPPPIYDSHAHSLVSHFDVAERVDTILHALEDLSWPVIRENGDYRLDPYFAVHDSDMIALFREVDQGITSGLLDSPLIPVDFAVRRLDTQPQSLDGRLGWYCTDVRTPLCTGFWAAACGTLSATIAAADLLLSGEQLVYVIARPAGHFAGRDFFGGGSYLNYVAGAATQLSRRSKVAVLEISYHHGSGTQDIFSTFKDVLFASVHADPSAVYPHYSGYADRHGKGRGAVRNFPLSFPLDERKFLNAVRGAVSEIKHIRPNRLIVSLSADLASQGGLATGLPGRSLPLTVYEEAGRHIASLGVPTLVIQEEGWDLENIGEAVRLFLGAFWKAFERR